MEKAQAAAAELTALLPSGASVEGSDNLQAARGADIAVLAVLFSAHAETLEAVKPVLEGKLLIDVSVPLVPGAKHKAQMPGAGSAAQEARQILGENVQVASAFQSISHIQLQSEGAIECDVLVTGTSPAARAEALKLVEAAGMTGWDAGPIENSAVVEGLASVLISINRKYGSKHAGIRITGVDRS
jgi:NADPH-dependent F420 reductase